MKRERHLFPESYRCLCELPPLPLKEAPLLLQPPPLLPEAFLLLQNDAVAQHGRRLLVALAAQLLLQERRRQWGFVFFSESDRRATVGVMGTWWSVEKANTSHQKKPEPIINVRQLTWRSCCCVWIKSLQCWSSSLSVSISSSQGSFKTESGVLLCTIRADDTVCVCGEGWVQKTCIFNFCNQ